MPSGGTSPLASETIPARSDMPRWMISPTAWAIALEGTATKTRSAFAEVVRLGAEGAHAQVARKLHARQVALVLARARELGGLLGPAREQRRAQAGPLEQQRHRGAEGAGADHGDATDMLARIADGGTLYARAD